MHQFKKTEEGFVDQNGVFWTEEEVAALEADTEIQAERDAEQQDIPDSRY